MQICLIVFNEMEDMRILINYDGYLEGNIYKDSYLEVVFVPKNLTYEVLLVMVHEIICVCFNSCVYELRSLFNTNDKVARFKIKNDRNIQYVLGEEDRILEVYVTIQHS